MADGNQVQLDQIKISVVVENNGSAAKLDGIARSVRNLASASQELKTFNGNIQGLTKLVSSLEKLNNVKISSTIATQLPKIREEVVNFNKLKSADGIETAAKAISKLNGITISSTLANNIPPLANAIKSISGVKIPPELTKVLASFSAINIPATIGNNLARIGRATESLANTDFTKLRELVEILSELKGLGTVNINMRGLNTAGAEAITIKKGDNGTTSVSSRSVEKTDNTKTIDSNKQATEEQTSATDGLKQAWESVSAACSKVAAVIYTVKNAISTIVSVVSTIHKIVKSIVTAIINAGKSVLTYFYGPFIKVGSAISGVIQKIKDFGAMVKRLALHRLIRNLIKQIGEGLSTGISNLYNWSTNMGTAFAESMDKIATSMMYFKNSVGAAVSPLINALAPALDYIIDKAVDLLNIINQLFAKLSGATSWTKAVKKATAYADATGSAAKNTEKLKRSLLAIDEIHALNNNDTSSGSGGSSSGTDTSGMFETVESIQLPDGLEKIWKVFEDAWENEGLDTVNAIKTAFADVKELFSEVGKSFSDVFTNGSGQKALELMLTTAQNVAGAISGIATNFTEAWKSGSTGTSIMQGLFNLANLMLEKVEGITASLKKWADDINLKPLLTSFDKLLNDGINPLVETLDGSFLWVWNNILIPLQSWVIEDAAPKSIQIFTGVLETLSTILTPVVDGFSEMWQETEDLRKSIKDLANNSLLSLVTYINRIATELKSADLSQIKNDAKEIGEKILESINDKMKTFSSWIEDLTSNGGSKLTNFLISVTETLGSFLMLIDSLSHATAQFGMNLLGLNAIFHGRFEAASQYFEMSRKINAEGTSSVSNISGIVKRTVKLLEDIGKSFDNVATASSDAGGEIAADLSAAKQKLEQFDSRVKKSATNIKTESENVTSNIDTDTTKTKSFFGRLVDALQYVSSSGFLACSSNANKIFSIDIPNYVQTGTNSIGNKWSTLFSGLKLDLGKVPGLFTTAFSGGATSISKALGNGGTLQAGIISGTNSAFKSFLNSMIKGINTAMNSCFSRLKNAIDKLKKISILGKQPFANLPTISIPYIPQLASGGMVSSGQMFIANESGPELVGKFGKQTGVMNNDQIVKSVADGVASANESQNSLLREQNNLLRQLLSKDADVRAYITTGDLVTGIQSMNKRTGRQVIPLNI